VRASLLALLLAAGAAGAADSIDWSRPPPLGPEPTYTPPVPEQLRLERGVPLWVISRRDLPLVTVRVIVRNAGSISDPAGKAGLANYAADLLDEGAGGLGPVDLAERLERLGTTLRTWAEEDAAYVEIQCLAKNLGPSLAIMSQVIIAPAFDPKEAARVKEDLLTAIALRRDHPGAVAHLILEGAVFGPESSYGHPTLGTADELKTVTVDEARAFYLKWYGAGAAGIVVAGDVVPADIKQLLDAQLGGWRKSPGGGDTGRAGAPSKARVLVVNRPDAEQSSLLVGGAGIPRGDGRAYALEVLANALGGTLSSRLMHRLREELGYTYGVRAVASYHKAAGLFFVDTSVVTPKTAESIREIVRIFDDVRRNGLTPDELVAAKHNLVRSLPQTFESVDGIAGAYSDLFATDLPPDWLVEYPKRIEAVGPADIKAVARSFLDTRRMRTVVVGDMTKIRKSLRPFGPMAELTPDGRPKP